VTWNEQWVWSDLYKETLDRTDCTVDIDHTLLESTPAEGCPDCDVAWDFERAWDPSRCGGVDADPETGGPKISERALGVDLDNCALYMYNGREVWADDYNWDDIHCDESSLSATAFTSTASADTLVTVDIFWEGDCQYESGPMSAIDADGDGLSIDDGDCDDTDSAVGLCWIDVDAGDRTTCGVTSAGTVECWGYDHDGVFTPPTDQFERVSIGRNGACAMDASSQVYCWGFDHPGKAFPDEWLEGRYTDIDIGYVYSCRVDNTGAVSCAGDELDGIDDATRSYTQVSSGLDHACALTTGGTAECWGSNFAGQRDAPFEEFDAVISGYRHSCGLSPSGEAKCWGSRDYGLQVSYPDIAFESLSSFATHNCGITTDGTAFCWGRDNRGQSSAPDGAFDAVSAGKEHSCGLRPNGSIECWGANDFGQSTPPEL